MLLPLSCLRVIGEDETMLPRVPFESSEVRAEAILCMGPIYPDEGNEIRDL